MLPLLTTLHTSDLMDHFVCVLHKFGNIGQGTQSIIFDISPPGVI